MHKYRLIADWLESSFAKEKLRILEGTKINISQQCALATKKASSLLGFIKQSVVRRQKDLSTQDW